MRTATIVTTICLLFAGCSSLPPEEYDDRRFEAEMYKADFLAFRRECWKQDRVVFIDAKHRHPRNGIPRLGDRYYCIRRNAYARSAASSSSPHSR